MKKGAVPIPYIIALLLGIAVVAILGYWFFVIGGQWGGEVTLQRCRTKAHTYCSSWRITGYSGCDEDEDDDVPIVGWFNQQCIDMHGDDLPLGGEAEGDCEFDREACKTLLAGA